MNLFIYFFAIVSFLFCFCWVGAGGRYLAPEYTQHGQVTNKLDVYSFGVVLLELVTGRKAIDITRPKGEQCLTEWVKKDQTYKNPPNLILYWIHTCTKFWCFVANFVQTSSQALLMMHIKEHWVFKKCTGFAQARPLLEEKGTIPIDPRLDNRYSDMEVHYMLHAAACCIRRDPQQRPNMSQASFVGFLHKFLFFAKP